jgi:hypothetical protein
MLPVPVDMPALLARLRAAEREQQDRLAALEARLREFEDVEQPAYARWLRLELGPTLAARDARREELRARHATVWRVQTLVERDGWDAREALWAVLHPEATPVRRDRMDPDVVAARRRAKVERKRAERRAARRASRQADSSAAEGGEDRASSNGAPQPPRRPRPIALFRAIARRLHPDSPSALRGHDPQRTKTLWTEAQAAYAARDADRLLAIAAWLDAADDAAPPLLPTSIGERHARLRGLARATAALERRLAALAADPAFDFASRTPRERARLRADAARQLDGELRRLEVAIAEVDAALEAIGPPRAPRNGRRR